MRLPNCGCRPTAYAPGSGHIVHSPACLVSPEADLTPEEFAWWRGYVTESAEWRGGHPAGTATPPDRQRLRIAGGFYNGQPQRQRDWQTRRSLCDCELCR